MRGESFELRRAEWTGGFVRKRFYCIVPESQLANWPIRLCSLCSFVALKTYVVKSIYTTKPGKYTCTANQVGKCLY